MTIEVALYMGAWIEIFSTSLMFQIEPVALYMGAWIEIKMTDGAFQGIHCRTLYGCVD